MRTRDEQILFQQCANGAFYTRYLSCLLDAAQDGAVRVEQLEKLNERIMEDVVELYEKWPYVEDESVREQIFDEACLIEDDSDDESSSDDGEEKENVPPKTCSHKKKGNGPRRLWGGSNMLDGYDSDSTYEDESHTSSRSKKGKGGRRKKKKVKATAKNKNGPANGRLSQGSLVHADSCAPSSNGLTPLANVVERPNMDTPQGQDLIRKYRECFSLLRDICYSSNDRQKMLAAITGLEETLKKRPEKEEDGNLYEMYHLPILKAMVQTVRVALVKRKDFGLFTSQLRNFYFVFGAQEELALSLIVLRTHRAKKLSVSINTLQHFGTTTGATNNEVANIDEDDESQDEDKDEDNEIASAAAKVKALKRATSETDEEGLWSALALKSAKKMGQVAATIDIVCSVMASTPFAVIATKDLKKRAQALLSLMKMDKSLVNKEGLMTADFWIELVEPGLTLHPEEAETVMTQLMYALANVNKNTKLREAYQRKGTTRIDGHGTGATDLDPYSGTRAQEFAKGQVIVTFSVLASKRIETRIHEHTGLKFDFLAVVLQNAKHYIVENCTFIWGGTRGPFVFSNNPEKVKLPALCEKLAVLLEGSFNGVKKTEYPSKKVALDVATRSIGLLSTVEKSTHDDTEEQENS